MSLVGDSAGTQANSPNTQTTVGLRRRLLDPGLVICVLLALTTVVLFWPVKNCGFVDYDDPEYVSSNDWVLRGVTWDGVVWAFGHTWAQNWHPLTWLSHMLDVSLFGTGPAGPHLVNVFLHACNAVLVFLLLDRMTRSRWGSAFVAGLFALHPVHVESVAWISERKDVLSSFFFLLSLLWYVRYAKTAPGEVQIRTLTVGAPRPHESNWRAAFRSRDYWVSVCLFALGLLCKPMLVTLPFLLLLLDWWPLNRAGNLRAPGLWLTRLVLEKTPFVFLAVISCVITVIAQKQVWAAHSLVELPLTARFANAAISYVRYLGKLIWPVNLAIPYPHPGHWPFYQTLFAVLVLAGVSYAAWRLWKRAPYVLVGWLWFVGMLVPVIGLVQVGIQSMADRYTYLPALGVFIIFTWAGAWVWRASGLPLWLAAVLAAGMLAGLAVRTRDQLGYWQNSGTLFRHTLAITPKNSIALINLGSFLYDENRLDEALAQYQRALLLFQEDADALNRIGSVYAQKNDAERAIEYYQRAARANPTFSDPHSNLGVILKKQGKVEEAMAEYRKALELSPKNAEAHNNLANLLMGQGQVVEAIPHYQQAVEISPRFTPALNNLAWALAQQGKYPEALSCCERAVKFKPEDASLRETFGDLLLQLGRSELARRQYQQAVELAPGSFDARMGLGRALARLGHRGLAADEFHQALRLKPEDADAKKELQACTTSVSP